MNELNSEQAVEFTECCLAAQLVPLLRGSPGVGKSSVFQAIAASQNLYPIDLRLAQSDPTDLNGFPAIDKSRNKAGYVPMDTFPIAGDDIPKGYNGWLLILDELPSAPQMVQVAAYKLILDRAVGLNKLHDQVYIVAAGNKADDNAVVDEVGTAMQSRLIHGEMKVDVEMWLKWARANNLDHRITALVQSIPSILHVFDPDHDDHTFRCPRTWEFASKLVSLWPDQIPDSYVQRALLMGAVGAAGAVDLIGFCKVYGQLPDIGEIVGSPNRAKVPNEPNQVHAVAAMVASHASTSNIEALLIYIDRLPVEFQVVSAREMIGRNQRIIAEPAMAKWVRKNGAKFY